MVNDKAQKRLEKIKKRDRIVLKHGQLYDGPPDWDFAVLNAPKEELEDMRDERPEVSNG